MSEQGALTDKTRIERIYSNGTDKCTQLCLN